MPLSPAQMDAIIEQHFHFEASDDVDGVLSTLTADVDHDIVGAPTGPVRGRDAARQFYESLFADLSDGQVVCLNRLHGDGFVVDESLWSGTASGAPFGLPGGGRPLSFRLLHVFEFDDSGALRRENVWLDLAAIQQQLPPL